VADADEIVVLRDGTRALIRPIGPHDRDRLREGFEQASDESIYLRFLGPHPRLTNNELDYLTAVDHVHHEALIAVDAETGQSFGTARYVRDDADPEAAEFAVGVGDRWMRIGLGTALLSALAKCARQAGIVRFNGVISAENMAIRALVKKVLGPYTTRSTHDGAAEIVVDFTSRPGT
jgi:GNAT superfamily N-acetyltransferase